MSDVFHALAAPARRAILDELHDRDGQTLFELCARLTMKHELGLSRQAISQHLQVLEEAGLVSSRREGRYKFHHLDTTPLRAIVQRWSIDRGRPNEMSRTDTGTAVVELVDRAGDFDPTNTGGAFYGRLEPGVPMGPMVQAAI